MSDNNDKAMSKSDVKWAFLGAASFAATAPMLLHAPEIPSEALKSLPALQNALSALPAVGFVAAFTVSALSFIKGVKGLNALPDHEPKTTPAAKAAKPSTYGL